MTLLFPLVLVLELECPQLQNDSNRAVILSHPDCTYTGCNATFICSGNLTLGAQNPTRTCVRNEANNGAVWNAALPTCFGKLNEEGRKHKSFYDAL